MAAMPRATSKASRERLAALTAGYRTLPGVRDEFLDEAGLPRPHWLPMLNGLAGMGPDEVERSFGIADRHQRDSGVYYRLYDAGESKESSWPLSHVPLVIPHDEWATISAGLMQRAELLDRVLTDAIRPGRSGARTARCRPPWWPRARISCGRWLASRPGAQGGCRSTRPISGAGRMAGGGCSATAPRLHPAWDMRWKTASPSRARCRTSMRR